ncbi:MAG: hypothetical protein AB1489_11630 [Acidobacteriota bacterium]
MPNNGILPRCNCCVPTQALVITGPRAHCPLTEIIYENLGDGNYLRLAAAQTHMAGNADWQAADFYPGRQKHRGDVAPMAINPAEDRFGA